MKKQETVSNKCVMPERMKKLGKNVDQDFVTKNNVPYVINQSKTVVMVWVAVRKDNVCA